MPAGMLRGDFSYYQVNQIFWLAFLLGRYTMGAAGKTWRFWGENPAAETVFPPPSNDHV